MKVLLELEFSDEEAADFFRWLQELPAGLTARWRQLGAEKPATSRDDLPELSEAGQNRVVLASTGSWQSAENGVELARQIRESFS